MSCFYLQLELKEKRNTGHGDVMKSNGDFPEKVCKFIGTLHF